MRTLLRSRTVFVAEEAGRLVAAVDGRRSDRPLRCRSTA